MSSEAPVDHTASMQFTSHVRKKELSYSKAFINIFIARKPMKELQSEVDTDNVLRRTLNWIQLTAIGLGSIIGMGIFVLSGVAAAQYSGPSVVIFFIFTGIVALLSALSFSELMAMMPISGAAYSYTYVALGEYLAWFIGWNYALLYQLAALAVVVGWSKYVVHFIHLISNQNITSSLVEAPLVWNDTAKGFSVTGQVLNLPAIVITIAITVLLISGIRPTAMVNLVLVGIKIIVLLIFIFVCYKYVNRNNYSLFIPPNPGSFNLYGIKGMLEGCTYVFFAYVGFDSVAAVAKEAKSPERMLPLATITSMIISFLIYIGICTVMVGLVSNKSLNAVSSRSEAIEATPYGLWLLIAMDLGAIASLTTVALMMLLSQTRVFYAMAFDGLLPPIFAKISSRTDIPWISTIISGVFCAIISGICPVDIVGETASISALITHLFVHIEVIIMRYTHKEVQRIFRVPFGSWLIPVVGSLLCILLMTRISKETYFRFLIWTAIGQVVYFSYGFWHSHRRLRKRLESISSEEKLVSTNGSTIIIDTDSTSELDLDDELNDSNVRKIFCSNPCRA